MTSRPSDFGGAADLQFLWHLRNQPEARIEARYRLKSDVAPDAPNDWRPARATTLRQLFEGGLEELSAFEVDFADADKRERFRFESDADHIVGAIITFDGGGVIENPIGQLGADIRRGVGNGAPKAELLAGRFWNGYLAATRTFWAEPPSGDSYYALVDHGILSSGHEVDPDGEKLGAGLLASWPSMYETPHLGWRSLDVVFDEREEIYRVDVAIESIDGPINLRFEDGSVLAFELPALGEALTLTAVHDTDLDLGEPAFELPIDVLVHQNVGSVEGIDAKDLASGIAARVVSQEILVRTGTRDGRISVVWHPSNGDDALTVVDGETEHGEIVLVGGLSNDGAAAEIAVQIDRMLTSAAATGKAPSRDGDLVPIGDLSLERPEVLEPADANALPAALEAVLTLATNLLQDGAWDSDYDTRSIVQRRMQYLSDYQRSPAFDNAAEQVIAEAAAANLAEILMKAIQPSDGANAILTRVEHAAHELASTDGSPRDPERARLAMSDVAHAIDEAKAKLAPDELSEILHTHQIDDAGDLGGEQLVKKNLNWAVNVVANAGDDVAADGNVIPPAVAGGSIIGSVLGAGVGFIIGGPLGAAAGAGIGTSAGSAVGAIAGLLMAIARRYRRKQDQP